MTREELRDYVDEQRTLDNIPYHVYSTLIDGIDTLEQDPVLEKIKAKIENDWQLKEYPSSPFSCGLRRAIEIIDKYKSESEE